MVTLLVSSSRHNDGKGNKKIKKHCLMSNKNSEHVANLLPDLFAIITQLALSNLIEMAV